MATQILKYVRNDGTGDYTTVNAALIGQVQNLVANDKYLDIAIDENYQETTSRIIVDGYTTDATHDIHIYTTALCRNTSGKWDTSKWYCNWTANGMNTGVLTINDDFVTLEGLQLQITDTSQSPRYGIYIAAQSATNLIKINNCMVKGHGSDLYYSYGLFLNDADINLWMKNVVIFNVGQHSSSFSYWMQGNTYIYNCLAYNGYRGFITRGGTSFIKNSLSLLSFTARNFQQLLGTLHCNYCASSDATADDFDGDGVSGNNHINHTFSFVDAANGDFRLKATDAGAKGLGTDLSGDAVYPFSDDIAGKTRIVPWDIGPWAGTIGSRTITDSIGFTDAIIRAVYFSRSVSDTINITDVLTRAVQFFRTIKNTINIKDATIWRVLLLIWDFLFTSKLRKTVYKSIERPELKSSVNQRLRRSKKI